MEAKEMNEGCITSQEVSVDDSGKSTKRKKKKVNGVKKKKPKPKKKLFTFHTCKICSKQFTNKASLQLHTGIHSTTYPYSCDLCPFKCKVSKYLSKHMRNVHSGPGSIECEVCGKRFRFPCQLQKHALVHTGEKPFACTVCGKTFNRTYSLNSHMLIHTGEKPFQCKFCEYACRDSSTLRKHQARHMGLEPLYQCKICSITVKNKWRLKTHVAEKHLDLDVKKHECEICGKRYKTKCVLNKHVRVVHKKSESCTCEYCGVRLNNKSNLPRHMMTHVNERPYKCMFEGCGKRYKDRTYLRKHAIIHYPEQHFTCEICDKKFTRKIRYQRHLDVHVPKKKNLQCDYCGAKFLTKNYISKHIRQKHMGEKEKFMCDLCDFVTHNKPSIVMHIKYGHGNENDRECTICGTIYKKHIYLKMHYAKTHGIRYKTKTRTPKVEIKEEPEDDVSIDLLEIEKHELIDEIDPEPEPEQTEETDMQDSSIQTREPEDVANEFIKENSKHLKKVPEEIFNEYYIQHVEKKHSENIKRDETFLLDKEMQAEAKRSVLKLLVKVRQKREVKALERMRQQYNERMRVAVRNAPKKENIKIKYFNNNNKKTEEQKINDAEDKNQTDNNETGENETVNNETGENETDNNETGENETEKFETDRKKDSTHTDSLNDKNNSSQSEDEENAKIIKNTGKLKCNSHQCYICFKLFPTKEKLLDHCQEHFDVCTSVSLKKCPLCEYVTKLNISRHMKAVHKVNVKIPYTRIKDKLDNSKGSRYYYEIKNKNIKKIELIPSIKNLNKIACMKMEKKNREVKAKTVAKTKLVKKGKEWVVEKEQINVSAEDFILPEFDENEIKINEKKTKLNEKLGNSYLDRMKRLSHLAKKNGKKMMFPCENCEKICLNFAALKLHSRKHDPNKKPFKPKVWKHKLKEVKDTKSKGTNKKGTEKPKGTESNAKKSETDNRSAKPKPIVNKHKCEPELKEFYEKNIRGGDIEFWQFLKIYNKMGRDNITDFTDLQKSTDFGIHTTTENVDNSTDSTAVTNKDFNVSVKVTRRKTKTKKFRYKRVIRISKKEYIRRNAIKNELRERIAKECN